MSELVEVRFEPGGVAAWVKPGCTILEASEAAGVDIFTGCEAGQCGTDAVKVLEGVDGLQAMGDDEEGTLERMGLEGDFRLACSAKLKSGKVVIQTDAF